MRWLPIVLLSLAVAGAYHNAPGGVFLWDDHLSNVLLHLVNTLVAFGLLARFVADRAAAFWAAALFAIHPINSEVVNYISCRPDLLMVLFSLLAMLAYHRSRETGARAFLGASLAAYALSMLSKETGLILPLAVAAYDAIIHPARESGRHRARGGRAPARWRLPAYLGFGAVLLAYVVARMTVWNFFPPGTFGRAVRSEVPIRILSFAKSLPVYLERLVVPVGLHSDYDPTVAVSLLDPVAWLAVLASVALAAAVLRWGRGDRRILFGAAWTLAGLAPISGVIPFNTVLAERYMYLPSIGVFLVLASLGVTAVRRVTSRALGWAAAAAGALPLVALSAVTVQRNPVWADPRTFFQDIATKTQRSYRANNNVGLEYVTRGDLAHAEAYFRRALAIHPDYAVAVNNSASSRRRRAGWMRPSAGMPGRSSLIRAIPWPGGTLPPSTSVASACRRRTTRSGRCWSVIPTIGRP
jgi:protein O-mannosyl-transferase